jgi:hypothetical protein
MLPGMRRLGYCFIAAAVVLQPFAVAAFTATAPIPRWLNVVGGIGFLGFVLLILTGIVLVAIGGRGRNPSS